MELVRVVGADGRVERALDLGCGAGAVAIAMARVAREVVATDIDERAAAFTRLNVRLNGARNVDVRVGDLYEPVRGERFDRIAAQPPFHALRPGVAASAFVHGGVRGDELASKIVAQAPEHLTERGMLVLLADWPMLAEGDDIATRIRPEVANVVVLRSPNKDLDEYCTLHAAAELSGDAFALAVIAQRDHLDALGIRGIALAWVVLQRTAHLDRAWASEIAVKHPHDAPMTWEHVSRIFRAHEAAHATDDVLMTTHLETPDGARFVEQPLGDGPSPVVLHPPPGWPEWPSVLDADVAASVTSLVKAGHPTNGAEIAAARRALLVGALRAAPV
jgi:SAM-dependent methyltransferase